jgi:hypothetical protein
MTTKVLVFDHDRERLGFVANMIRTNFDRFVVSEFRIGSPNEPLDLNLTREFRSKKYDLIVGNLDGKPTGKEALDAYKREQPRGRAVLYTDNEHISVDDFEGYKLANGLVKWGPVTIDRDRLTLVDKIRSAVQEKPITYWTSPLKSKEFWGTLAGVLVVALPLLTAILKFFEPAAATR